MIQKTFNRNSVETVEICFFQSKTKYSFGMKKKRSNMQMCGTDNFRTNIRRIRNVFFSSKKVKKFKLEKYANLRKSLIARQIVISLNYNNHRARYSGARANRFR